MSTLADKQREIERAWALHQGRRVPAEVWRRVRAFKRSIAPEAAKLSRALSDKTTMQRLFTDFPFKKGIGRARALARLQKHLTGATLQAGDGAVVITWLEPTGPLLDSEDPSLQQDCIIVCLGIELRFLEDHNGVQDFLSRWLRAEFVEVGGVDRKSVV